MLLSNNISYLEISDWDPVLLDFESADEKAKKQSGDHDQPKKENGHPCYSGRPCHCNSGKNKSQSKIKENYDEGVDIYSFLKAFLKA